jgi:uncharacterized protein
MFKKFAVAAAIVFASSAACAQGLPAYPFIHTNGTGSTIVIPDMGEIDFEIVATDADPEVARGVIDTRIAQIRAVGEGVGIAVEDIETRDVRREINKGANAVPGVLMYDIKVGVHVKVRNLTVWASFLSPLLNMPNLEGFMTEFGSTEREATEALLLGEAVKDARRRASGLAAGFGKKLGEVTAVTAGQLSNLTRAMGLSPRDPFYSRNANRTLTPKKDLLMIESLKFAQPVDVIFKIK